MSLVVCLSEKVREKFSTHEADPKQLVELLVQRLGGQSWVNHNVVHGMRSDNSRVAVSGISKRCVFAYNLLSPRLADRLQLGQATNTKVIPGFA